MASRPWLPRSAARSKAGIPANSAAPSFEITGDTPLFHGVWRSGDRPPVWMSHGDRVTKLPDGFRAVAVSNGAPFAAIADDARKLYGVQFHPEVVHTPDGAKLIANFVHRIAGCPAIGPWRSSAPPKSRASERRSRTAA